MKKNVNIKFCNVSFKHRIKMFLKRLIGRLQIQAKGFYSNEILIGNSHLGKCLKLIFMGNNNTIEIGDKCSLNQCNKVFIQGDNNKLTIGNNVIFDQNVSLVMAEGSSIEIREGCLFAKDVQIRTSDQHPIFDDNGNRLNAAKNVCVGKNCWIGNGALINKGVNIGENSIVAAKAVVTSDVPPNTMVAGVPATVKKKNIHWMRKILDDNEQRRLFGYD